ncbi:hypothetical protein FAM15113_001941 [Propionibacterium freudenreichii]|nr:hypothetical protein [Propionibacterium freudenreichii]
MAFMFWWIVADLVDMKASWSGPLILALVAALLLVCAGLVLLVRYASGSESAGSWIKGFCIVVLGDVKASKQHGARRRAVERMPRWA